MQCPQCQGGTNPLNTERTIFECIKCNHRFHIHGVTVDNAIIEGHPLSPAWQYHQIAIQNAKIEARVIEENPMILGRKR